MFLKVPEINVLVYICGLLCLEISGHVSGVANTQSKQTAAPTATEKRYVTAFAALETGTEFDVKAKVPASTSSPAATSNTGSMRATEAEATTKRFEETKIKDMHSNLANLSNAQSANFLHNSNITKNKNMHSAVWGKTIKLDSKSIEISTTNQQQSNRRLQQSVGNRKTFTRATSPVVEPIKRSTANHTAYKQHATNLPKNEYVHVSGSTEIVKSAEFKQPSSAESFFVHPNTEQMKHLTVQQEMLQYTEPNNVITPRNSNQRNNYNNNNNSKNAVSNMANLTSATAATATQLTERKVARNKEKPHMPHMQQKSVKFGNLKKESDFQVATATATAAAAAAAATKIAYKNVPTYFLSEERNTVAMHQKNHILETQTNDNTTLAQQIHEPLSARNINKSNVNLGLGQSHKKVVALVGTEDFMERRVKKSFPKPVQRHREASDVMSLPHIDFANTKFKIDTRNLLQAQFTLTTNRSNIPVDSVAVAGTQVAAAAHKNVVRITKVQPEFSTTKFYNNKEFQNEMLQRKKEQEEELQLQRQRQRQLRQRHYDIEQGTLIAAAYNITSNSSNTEGIISNRNPLTNNITSNIATAVSNQQHKVLKNTKDFDKQMHLTIKMPASIELKVPTTTAKDATNTTHTTHTTHTTSTTIRTTVVGNDEYKLRETLVATYLNKNHREVKRAKQQTNFIRHKGTPAIITPTSIPNQIPAAAATTTTRTATVQISTEAKLNASNTTKINSTSTSTNTNTRTRTSTSTSSGNSNTTNNSSKHSNIQAIIAPSITTADTNTSTTAPTTASNTLTIPVVNVLNKSSARIATINWRPTFTATATPLPSISIESVNATITTTSTTTTSTTSASSTSTGFAAGFNGAAAPDTTHTISRTAITGDTLSYAAYLTKSTSKPIAHPRLLNRLQEKINSLECEIQNVTQDSHLWRGNETHELLLPFASPESCEIEHKCSGVSWSAEAEIQSGDIIIVEINDTTLIQKTSKLSYEYTYIIHNILVYQVTRAGHDHCDVTEGILMDITPLVVDGRKFLTLYDKDLTEGVNLLIVVSENWGKNCVRLKVTTKIDNCGEDADCSGKGICYSNAVMEEYECQCCTGFTGPHCEEIDACTPNPCINNGICIDISQGHEGGAYQCLCPYGYIGKNCQFEADPCNPAECLNGGTCLGNSTHFRCDCKPGFTGLFCQHSMNFCESSPCMHGICVDHEHGFRCFCQPGFAGELCSYEYNECESNPCQNGAECVDYIGRYGCNCAKGYTGTRCQVKVDLCADTPCAPGLLCVDNGGNYSCVCPKGELDCKEAQRTQCSENMCTHGGTCWLSGATFYCACRPGYTGIKCEDEFVVETVVSTDEFMVDDTHINNYNDKSFEIAEQNSLRLKDSADLQHMIYLVAAAFATTILSVCIVASIEIHRRFIYS
ncbi:serine-rich adhesin for platelets-like [Teleopsis dalmanni]|uniref:serine-rich adhesin for platelets-like n=1 Tax=Teleopsis dalmanni TaxID=139649 RepID=UPI0018CF2B2B|nr:serine-rich adhesin for platelets-like [Teleopsis dalmanni]